MNLIWIHKAMKRKLIFKTTIRFAETTSYNNSVLGFMTFPLIKGTKNLTLTTTLLLFP